MTTQNLFLDMASDPSGVLGLSPGIGAVMTDYVEGILASSSSSRSRELEAALVDLFYISLKRCPSDVVLAIQGVNDATEASRAAYLMGHISFAQSLVSQNLSHKVCSDFKAAVVHDVNIDYVRALYSRDMTNKELVAVVGKVEESVSRRLKKLREWGITEYRKQGTSVINFLTPAARKIFEGIDGDELDHAPRVSASLIPANALRLIKEKTGELPPHMKEFSALGARKVA